jgi:hypothetical protein
MKPALVTYAKIKDLSSKHAGLEIIDNIDLALGELFDIYYPAKKDSKTAAEVKDFINKTTKDNTNDWGVWVYYPWLNKVIHFPPVKDFRALRTSRNRNLITVVEQAKLYDTTILIAGMSVGSNVVEALISQGIGSRFVLVDMDVIEPTNLNRIRAPYYHVGLHKVEAISRKVWEIDPFMEIIDYRDGLNIGNLKEILENHKPDILIDEMDELGMKIAVREAAKKHRLPVIMAADDGDDALIDIERYDLNPDQGLFSNRIPDKIIDEIKRGQIPRARLGFMIGKYFVGTDNIPLRMYQSLMEVGKTLPSWPQLGGAAALSGISLAYVSKRIILGQGTVEGRVLVSLDQKLGKDHLDEEHQKQLNMFKKGLERQE